MRAAIFSFAFLTLALAVPAAAQTKEYASAADIQALIAKAKADRKGDAPTTVVPMLDADKYRINLEYRPIPAPANLHKVEVEIMVVLEGSGTATVGGAMASPSAIDANNERAPSITGGMDRAFAKGDVLIIPHNTPHQITKVDQTMVLMTVRLPAGN